MEAQQVDLLPVDYYHVVFTPPAQVADMAYQNKAVLYGLLFDLAAEVLQTIAATRSTWAPGSAPLWCCTPGVQR